jgi:hypothetical protein
LRATWLFGPRGSVFVRNTFVELNGFHDIGWFNWLHTSFPCQFVYFGRAMSLSDQLPALDPDKIGVVDCPQTSRKRARKTFHKRTLDRGLERGGGVGGGGEGGVERHQLPGSTASHRTFLLISCSYFFKSIFYFPLSIQEFLILFSVPHFPFQLPILFLFYSF